MHLSYLIPFVARLSIFFFVATLAAMLDSLNPCARLGIEPAPPQQPEPLNQLHHSGSSISMRFCASSFLGASSVSVRRSWLVGCPAI